MHDERDIREWMDGYGVSREGAIELIEYQEEAMRRHEEHRMAAGREHYERRIAQQRAADKRRVKRKEDIDWRKDEQ
jgi:hypothetical protein